MPKSASCRRLSRLPSEQAMHRRSGDGAFESPPEYFDGGLRERVALEDGKAVVQVLCGLVLASNDVWSEHLRDVVEDGAGALGQVRGREEGRRLRPCRVALARRPDEHAVDLVVLPVGRPPRVNEWHLHVVHVESFELHGVPSPSDSRYRHFAPRGNYTTRHGPLHSMTFG